MTTKASVVVNSMERVNTPSLSFPFFPFSAAAVVSCQDAQWMEIGYSARLTDDNGHRTCVARICYGFISYTVESSSVLKVLCSSKFFCADEITMDGYSMDRPYETRMQ